MNARSGRWVGRHAAARLLALLPLRPPLPLSRAISVVVALGVGVAGCPRASEEDDAKRMPKPPPPPTVEIPAALTIAVTVDGGVAPAIDAARLASRAPDFADDDRRAWRLTEVLGAPAKRAFAVMAVAREGGPEVLLRASTPADAGLVPVLLVSRRGEVVATMLDPKQPFPAYHGRGGRLGRGGDPLPRVSGVTAIRVFVDHAQPQPVAPTPSSPSSTPTPLPP